jgi:hypothetical protein
MRAGSAMRGAAILVLACALCLGSTACSPAPVDGGVRGLVTIGPTAPVQRVGESGQTPYAADITVQSTSGTVVARTRSGADGTFSVNLAPGAYTLVPQNGDPLPIAQPVEVLAPPHGFADVTISYDSGIR